MRGDGPLSERLAAARRTLGVMLSAGEIDDPEASFELRQLELFLLGAAEEAREMEVTIRKSAQQTEVYKWAAGFPE